MKEYSLKSGLLDRRRKLALTEEYLEWENGDLKGKEFTRINKSDYVDFKHGMDWIVWYKFTVGRRFLITVKDKDGKELKLRFSSYFRSNENDKKYSEIVNDIWRFYHSDVVDGFLNTYYDEGEIEIKGIKVRSDGIEPGAGKGLIPWNKVTTKDYRRYFSICHRDRPEIHSIVSYNEYGAETLWSVVNTILKEK